MSKNSARPAAVEPAAELTADEIGRYSRQLILPDIGMLGQRRLKNAKVLVIGAGGLGAPALLYLAAAGVGTIGIVDDDTVDLSNLSRQVIHSMADVGRPKIDSAAESIAALNPLVRVDKHRLRLTSGNAEEIFSRYDVVLDGTDNFGTRYLISDAAADAGKPHVWGSILRFDGQVSVFYGGDAGAGDVRGPTYRDLYPESPPAGLAPSCEEAGVLGVLCSSIGSVMAGEAVKLVTGIGRTLIGRLLVFDALDMTWQEIPVATGDTPPPARPDPEPEPVHDDFTPPSVSAPELAARLADREAGRDDFELIDVRGPAEHDIVAVPGARVLPLAEFETGRALAELPSDKDIIVHCKSGGRSLRAVRLMHDAGFARAIQMDGGVLAWIDQVAPDQPKY
ncbi:molybdopterin-synthase adenylyltransferase MoeB [Spelaeicoccus albus]|uniref:Adenylyltransferase/sulfurtransferase n=1 Tax=Spelaeicoccus albus TaxID=1280376 RepID=A0A7Z0D3B4_9MICO|nr:molybdopterin-synthase adenylyltransferase MoeB [Spelaeicoccus albus]NYI68099.1 adenylyltransferase/sulfurtransferase [Spelaeicoccus albus]